MRPGSTIGIVPRFGLGQTPEEEKLRSIRREKAREKEKEAASWIKDLPPEIQIAGVFMGALILMRIVKGVL